jgi:2-polyprenyl-3-methyl-5-hydroxy-6-metoxy-1,4-benzoquinol methylase
LTPTVRKVPRKSTQQIAREWDQLAPTRAAQIRSGIDLSFDRILVPSLLSMVHSGSKTTLLDVGCGTGALTSRLAKQFGTTMGIDPSAKSIEIARRDFGAEKNLEFQSFSVEQFASRSSAGYDVVVANMTLMTAPNLPEVLHAIAALTERAGQLVFSITHPWFWAFYWNYADSSWFHYSEEQFIEANFTITHDATDYITTHIHRPLSMYSRELIRAGFIVELIEEPVPSADVEELYSEPWAYPRFLLASCRRM